MARFSKRRKTGSLNRSSKGHSVPNSNRPSRRHAVNEELEDEHSVLPDAHYSPDDAELSEDEMEEPVFDLRSHDSDESEGMEESDEDEEQLTGLAAKMAKQAKILRQKTGWKEDEESEEEGEEKKEVAAWGKQKRMYYNADNVDYELQSSDEDSPAEEEAEALRLQRLRAESLRPEDFGLDEEDNLEPNEETLQDIVERAAFRDGERKPLDVVSKTEKGTENRKVIFVEKASKDFNAMSKEEQMEVVRSDAPELVSLHKEFRESLDELKSKVEPALMKVKGGHYATKKGVNYLEMKHALLLSYCQTILFYLLLKAEHQSVRDHPVIARLVEIRMLLEKIRPVDIKLQDQLSKLVNESSPQIKKFDLTLESGKLDQNTLTSKTDVLSEENNDMHQSHQTTVQIKDNAGERMIPPEEEVVFRQASGNASIREGSYELEGRYRVSMEIIGPESKEMLQEREQIEARLQQDDFLYMPVTKKQTQKQKQKQKLPKRSRNGHVRILDDLADDIADLDEDQPIRAGPPELAKQRKLSELISAVGTKKPKKVVSGDADVPVKDDIGTRRAKLEMQKLTKLQNNEDNEMSEDKDGDKLEEDEFYQEAKKLKADKQALKVAKYARSVSSSKEDVAEGKRHITYEMEKNKGLTPYRKKLTKNPRKKYKVKHSKAVVRRKGQVRELKFPQGPYGGETTGIRANISRSIRFH